VWSFRPADDQLLHAWLDDGTRYTKGEYTKGECLPDPLMAIHPQNCQPFLPDTKAHILWHIQCSNNLPMVRVVPLINQFAIFFLGRPLDEDKLVSSSSLLYCLKQLRVINQHHFKVMFKQWITTHDEYGFIKLWYIVTDDSKHHKTEHHVVIMTAHVGEADDVKAKPGFGLLSDGATQAKNSSGNSNANLDTMQENLDMTILAHFAGGTTDNAADAKKEVIVSFDKVQDLVKADPNLAAMDTLYGYERLPMRLANGFHNGNLVVTCVSVAAFGHPKCDAPMQNQHRHFLKELHDLHSADNSPLG